MGNSCVSFVLGQSGTPVPTVFQKNVPLSAVKDLHAQITSSKVGEGLAPPATPSKVGEGLAPPGFLCKYAPAEL